MARFDPRVRDLQVRLRERGHDIAADGLFGPRTLNAALAALGGPVEPAGGASGPAGPAAAGEPPWLPVARSLLGTREIPGPKHSSFIAEGWSRLGAPWFNDDETPWCGFFVAHCLQEVGIAIPGKGLFARARAWLDWGTACSPMVGAVAVFGRDGGGHVGFVVGESSAHYYVLGGNQSNMVSIAPIAKARSLGFRWPGAPPPAAPLPAMSGGAVSRDEA
jgi:uncharacterized protein (TIGR02594 family)